MPVQGVSMLGACCWLDFEQEAQQAVSKQGVHLARQSWGGSARPHTFTTSLHPALYEQVRALRVCGDSRADIRCSLHALQYTLRRAVGCQAVQRGSGSGAAWLPVRPEGPDGSVSVALA